jgi:hypothetical protein
LVPVLAVIFMANFRDSQAAEPQAVVANTVPEEVTLNWAREVFARRTRTRKILPPFQIPRPLKTL